MKSIAFFQFSTEEDLSFVLEFSGLDLTGRDFEIKVTERASNTTKVTLTNGAGITITGTNVLEAEYAKAGMAGWARGEYSADVVDVTGGAHSRIMAVRFDYNLPGRLVQGVQDRKAYISWSPNQAVVTATGGIGQKGAKGDKGDQGDQGEQGNTGPSGTIAVGDVITGAAGSEASVTNVGTSTAAIFDFEIPEGAQGIQGNAGNKGWSPSFAVVTDGARRVLQVNDWAGGEGGKPATGDYVGATGLTPIIGGAVDIRGPAGTATIPDGDKGDITTADSGDTWTLNDDAVDLDKLAASVYVDQPTAEAGTATGGVMHSLGVKQSITVNAEKANFTAAGAEVGDIRSIQEALRDLPGVSIELYYREDDDSGKWGPALARALADSAVKRINFGAAQYDFDSAIEINRSDILIAGLGRNLTKFEVKGSTPILFDIGSAVAPIFNVYIEGIVISRETVTPGSKVMRVRNTNLFDFTDSRLYMDNKWGSGIEIQSGIYHEYTKLLIENPIDHAVEMYGGPGGVGGPDGWLVEHLWERCKFVGGNAGKASPQDQGTVIMGDHVSAVWMNNCSSHSGLGAFVDQRGTPANIDRNTLNLFTNLNCEATHTDSCTLRIGAYNNTQLLGGWCSGKGMPAIVCTEDSVSNRVTAVQIGIQSGDGIEDSGTSNRFEGNEFVGYSSGAAAVRFKSGSSLGIVKGGEAEQLVNIVVNEAGDSAKHHFDDLDVFSISGAPVTGFGPGSNKVGRIRNHDASPYVARTTSTLDIPWGSGDATISVTSGTGFIDNLRAGYWFGEKVTICFEQSGQEVRDIVSSGGGNIYLGAATTLLSDGRLIATFQWRGSGWWCVSTNKLP